MATKLECQNLKTAACDCQPVTDSNVNRRYTRWRCIDTSIHWCIEKSLHRNRERERSLL